MASRFLLTARYRSLLSILKATPWDFWVYCPLARTEGSGGWH